MQKLPDDLIYIISFYLEPEEINKWIITSKHYLCALKQSITDWNSAITTIRTYALSNIHKISKHALFINPWGYYEDNIPEALPSYYGWNRQDPYFIKLLIQLFIQHSPDNDGYKYSWQLALIHDIYTCKNWWTEPCRKNIALKLQNNHCS